MKLLNTSTGSSCNTSIDTAKIRLCVYSILTPGAEIHLIPEDLVEHIEFCNMYNVPIEEKEVYLPGLTILKIII